MAILRVAVYGPSRNFSGQIAFGVESWDEEEAVWVSVSARMLSARMLSGLMSTFPTVWPNIFFIKIIAFGAKIREPMFFILTVKPIGPDLIKVGALNSSIAP